MYLGIPFCKLIHRLFPVATACIYAGVACLSLIAMIAMTAMTTMTALAEPSSFENSEIRVIKNKFFTKRFRVELSAGLGAVMNQSFHNSYLLEGGLGFHFTETIGLHLEGSYFLNQNKYECEALGGEEFRISPKINEASTAFGAALSYTPIYGKYQLTSGDVLYFDWFFAGGGGLISNRERQGGCGKEELLVLASSSTPQVNIGTGQRYFVGKDVAVIWKLKLLAFAPAAEDGKSSLTENGVQNVILSLGVGYFL